MMNIQQVSGTFWQRGTQTISWNERLRKIKFLVLDVDGVMTDGGLYYSRNGEEMKRFYARDGMGLNLVRAKGVEVAILTGEESQIVPARAKKLKIEHTYVSVHDKLPKLKEILKNLSLMPEEVSYIGDDVNDLEVLQFVGFSACPGDAIDEVKRVVHYICAIGGGKGCIREVCDMICQAKE